MKPNELGFIRPEKGKRRTLNDLEPAIMECLVSKCQFDDIADFFYVSRKTIERFWAKLENPKKYKASENRRIITTYAVRDNNGEAHWFDIYAPIRRKYKGKPQRKGAKPGRKRTVLTDEVIATIAAHKMWTEKENINWTGKAAASVVKEELGIDLSPQRACEALLMAEKYLTAKAREEREEDRRRFDEAPGSLPPHEWLEEFCSRTARYLANGVISQETHDTLVAEARETIAGIVNDENGLSAAEI